MDRYVENGDVSGGNFIMDSHTIYEANNMSVIYSTKERYGNVTNVP